MYLKRLKAITLIFVLLLCCVCLIACEQKPDGGNISANEGEETVVGTLEKATNISIDQYTITWDAVPLATYYGVVIDGDEHMIDGTSFDLRTINLPKGAYSVQVKAYTDRKGYLNSVSQPKAFNYVGIEGTKYIVQIVSQEGGTTNITTKEYKANNVVDLIAYPKDGYHFDGWYSDNYYKLSSDKTFSFSINNNTVIFANFSPNTETLSKEASEDSEIMRCAEDFAVVVLCPDGENYIKEHFFVYDDYFLDDSGNVVSGCEDYAERELGRIENRGNDLYLISPKEEYAKSGAYVAKATGNVSILKEYSRFMNSDGAKNAAKNGADPTDMDLSSLIDDQGVDALTFSIDNTPHENINLREDVYIYSYGNNPNATSNNVDGWILERVGTGIYDPDTDTYGGFTTRSITVKNGYTLKVGDVVGFGGSMTKNISVSQIDETSVFGKIHDIIYCGDTEYDPIIYVELESVEQDSDVFDVLDVYAEGAVDIEDYIDANNAAIKEGAVKMFFNSEDFQKFLASVEVATESYAEENDCEFSAPMNAASFLDKIKITPSLKRDGNKFTLSIKGSIDIEFGKKENSFGKAGGTFSISFEFKETLKFEYNFSWIKKDVKIWFVQFKITNGVDLKLITTSETKFVFDVAVKYSAGTQTGYLLNENTKWIHNPNCFHVKTMLESHKKNTTESLEALEKKGYTQCKDCIGKSAKWVLNTSTKCIHRRGCWHIKQMLLTNRKPSDLPLDYLVEQGYMPCGTCLADPKDETIDLEGTEAYRQKLSKTLNYEDWGEKLKEIKDSVQNSEGVYDSSKDFKICEIPVTCVVTFWFKAYLTLSFNIEASVHYEQSTSTQVTIGVRAAIGEGFHTSYEKKELGSTKEMTIVGKIGVKAGIKLEVAVSDPLNIVSFGIYGTVGAYAELSGIVHLSDKGENYAAAYLEIGFYYDFGITYKVLVLKGSVSIAKACGLPGKVPLLQMGYNKVIYAYTTDVSETLLQTSENKKVFTLRELNLMGVKKISLPSMKTSTETLDPTDSAYNVNMKLASGEYLYIDGVNIRVKDNAPFGTTFEDEVTISITSKDKSWKKFSGTNSILYLPTITVKLICSNKCQEHSLILLETIDPQCTETGLEECLMCTRCFKLFDVEMTKELSERVVIPALGHDNVPIPAVEAECMKTGLTEGTICQRCRYISVPQQVVDALGHEAGEEWYVEKDATCEEQGRAYQGCIRCNLPMNYTTILPHGHTVGDQELSCQAPVMCLTCNKVLAEATGHKYEKVMGESYDATCTTAGRLVKQCAYCSETTAEELPALGHSGWESATERTIIKSAKCEEEGIYIYTCTRCGESIDGNVDPSGRKPALGHNFSDEFTLDYAAGCVTEGKESRHCSWCEKVAESHILPSFGGHDWGEWINTKEPKCEEIGSRERECDRCGAKETEPIPALGHDWSTEWTIDIEVQCTVDGQKSHHCLREGCTATKDSNPIYAPGHQWGDAIAYPYDPDDPDHIGCDDVGSGYHICTVCQVREDTACGHTIEGYSCNSPCTRCGVVTTAHKKGTPFKVVAATCTEDGEEWAQCTVCKDIVYTILKAPGHSAVRRDATAVSCTTDGNICYWYCAACEKYFSNESLTTEITQEDTVISAPGHHCVLSGTNYATTCEADGTETYTCDRVDYEYTYNGKTYILNCDHTDGYTYTVTIPKHAHVWKKNNAESKVPTCTEDGYDYYDCNCGRDDCECTATKTEALSKIGHDYETVVTSETCVSDGYITRTCMKNCGKDGHTIVLCYLPDTDKYRVTIEKNGGNIVWTVSGSAEFNSKIAETIPGEDVTYSAKYGLGVGFSAAHFDRASELAAHGLTYTAARPAGCFVDGNKEYYYCATCNKYYKDANATQVTTLAECTLTQYGEHKWDKVKERYSGSAVCIGNYTIYECSRCDEAPDKKEYDEHGEIENGCCKKCGQLLTYKREGNYVWFGTYPQVDVTDTLGTVLNGQAGVSPLPTESNSQNWTSYGYYISSSNSTDYMWYVDLTYNGEKYRGVYFTSCRPYLTEYSSSTDNSFQDDNGYTTSTVYWFRYDSIKWRILSEENGVALILCEMIIDNQTYQNTYSGSNPYYNNSTGTPDGIYSNNYEYSTICAWLNNTFYNTAFSDLQKALIQTTTLDNSARSTNPNSNAIQWNSGNNTYACENTQDKVFLLSEQDVTKAVYYFDENHSAYDVVRQKKTTDYAQSQGAYTSISSNYLGNGWWWLRSPHYSFSSSARRVADYGHADSYGVCCATGGVVPALKIRLSYTRIDENGTADASGDYLYFGTYPQTEVTDSATKSALTSLAGTLPTASDSQNWTSYGYYISSSNSTDYMWYVDLNYNNEKYRGVYFTSYRPYYTTNSSSADSTYQDDNGYTTSTVYWFRYDPIKWRILSEENGEALILCEMIIDSQEYYPSSSGSTFSHNGGTGYANNYALSNIRKWLNETFYNTAFSDLQKALIQTTTVDNSARSTNPNNNETQWNSGNNTYVCDDTQDKVFLLSEQEVTNSEYGFGTWDSYGPTNIRCKKNTDYAKCQGVWTSTDSSYLGNGSWWLRSPYSDHSYSARRVSGGGNAYNYGSVNCANSGVVPALVIRLS